MEGMFEKMVEAEWRLLELSSGEPVEQTAIDEVIVEQVGTGSSPPTIRFWQMDRPAISIGKAQDLYADVDVDSAEKDGVSIVRRQSSGGSDYLSPSDICYSVIIPAHLLSHDRYEVQQNYLWVYEKIERALGELGIQARFEKPCNIMTGDKKIGNMAQFNLAKVVLVHGKIRYSLPIEKTLGHFTCVECDDKHSLLAHKDNFVEAMTSVGQHEISMARLYTALRGQLMAGFKHSKGSLTPEEQKLLVEKKAFYSSKDWLGGVGSHLKREGFCDEHLNGVPIINIYKPQQKVFKE